MSRIISGSSHVTEKCMDSRRSISKGTTLAAHPATPSCPPWLPEHQFAQAFHPLPLSQALHPANRCDRSALAHDWLKNEHRQNSDQDDMTGSLPQASRERFRRQESEAHQKQYRFLLWGTVCKRSLETGQPPRDYTVGN